MIRKCPYCETWTVVWTVDDEGIVYWYCIKCQKTTSSSITTVT